MQCVGSSLRPCELLESCSPDDVFTRTARNDIKITVAQANFVSFEYDSQPSQTKSCTQEHDFGRQHDAPFVS